MQQLYRTQQAATIIPSFTITDANNMPDVLGTVNIMDQTFLSRGFLVFQPENCQVLPNTPHPIGCNIQQLI